MINRWGLLCAEHKDCRKDTILCLLAKDLICSRGILWHGNLRYLKCIFTIFSSQVKQIFIVAVTVHICISHIVATFMKYIEPFQRKLNKGNFCRHCSKYLREQVCFFIPHSRGLIQLFLLKFWVKQGSGRMLYITASKLLQKLWNWPHVHSIEKKSLFP